MDIFELKSGGLTLSAIPDVFRYTFTLPGGSSWTMTRRPYVRFGDGRTIPFPKPESVSFYRSGTADGLKIVYGGFEGSGIRANVQVRLDRDTSDAVFQLFLTGDGMNEIDHVSFPGPVDFGASPGEGYTVLPRMHGSLFPAGVPLVIADGQIYERDGYMPLFGQVRGDSGYAAIYETPFDAKYTVTEDQVLPLFRNSLGRMNYASRMRYCFRENCDYNTIAKCYRSYLKERGMLVTLKEKAVRNPNVERVIGVPVIHAGIAYHNTPESHFYDPDNPEANDSFVTFEERAQELRKLKESGLERAYTHFDGWGFHGYDNLHPSPFPPHDGAGGAAGMAKVSDTCREIGYVFGIHDQYRDYYYDNPDFDIDEAVEDAAGNHPYHSYWCGGSQTYLCSGLAPDYVRRNYNRFEELGIKIEASYLDVFSVVEMDECYNPDHPATRAQCAKNRRHCLDMLTDRGIIPSSEEALDCIIPSLVLCHHAPFYVAELGGCESEAVGIPIPLLSLVYHDCLIIPWIGLPGERGGWCIPAADSAYTYAILYGEPVYCPIGATAAEIGDVKKACESSGRLAYEEMVRHEFVDGNYRIQRTFFSDGTVITADLDSGKFGIAKKP